MLEVHGLDQRHGARVALAGVSLRLPAHQSPALPGPNGAGKTTLFQVLTGMLAADAGEVLVAGISLRDNAPAAWRRIGVVFQQPALDLTVRRSLLL
ncbi:MAG: ATP-binding cassette domain-containing protein [Pseudomonadota bacterium]